MVESIIKDKFASLQEDNEIRQDKFGSSILLYYLPYLALAFLLILYVGIAISPRNWWIFFILQCLLIIISYRIIYGPQGKKIFSFIGQMTTPIILAIGGVGSFLVVNGLLPRILVAILFSVAIAGQLKSITRLPQNILDHYPIFFAENISAFNSSLAVFSMALVGASLTILLRFSIAGVLGITLLVNLWIVKDTLRFTTIKQTRKTISAWLVSLVITEFLAIFLLYPFTPFLIAGFILTIYIFLLEIVKHPDLNRKEFLRRVMALALAWFLLFSSTRWT